MTKEDDITSLGKLLNKLKELAFNFDRISLGTVLEEIGHRSFGPVLLCGGLIILSPGLGDLPGVPSTIAALVLLTAGQLLLGRESLWLPRWLLDRSIARSTLCKLVRWLRPIARFVDRWFRPRLVGFASEKAIAVVSVVIAAATPLMEVIPFSANVAGAALVTLGLTLVAHDGVLALFAYLMLATAGGIAIYHLL